MTDGCSVPANRWLGVGLVTCVGVLFALPMLLLLTAGVSPIAVVTESLAYRYFNSLRILEGEHGLVFIVQGQTSGLLHHTLVVLLRLIGISPSNLRASLDAFTYLYLGVNSVAVVALLVLAVRDRRLTWTDRLAVAIVPVWGTYSSQGALSLSFRPDYYTVETMLTTAAVLLFLRYWRGRPDDATWITVMALGCFAGALAGTKIGLFWTGVLVAVPVVLGGTRVVIWIVRSAAFGVLAVSMFALVTVTFYLFDLSILPDFFARWLAFVTNPGGEDRFWISVFFPGSPGSNVSADYGYARLIFPLWLTAVGVSFWSTVRRWRIDARAWRVPAIVLALGGWQLIGLVVRPAGTTLYESSLFAVASGGIVLATLPSGQLRWSVVGAFVGLLAVHCLVSGIVNGPTIMPLSDIRASGDTVWEAHRWLQTQGHPVVSFIPDNRHTAGTVEEALLKGMSDLPTWNITQGSALLARLAPGLSFQQTMDTVPPGVTVFWIEVDGDPQLTDQIPALGAFARAGQLAGQGRCRSWRIATYPWYQRTLHACQPEG